MNSSSAPSAKAITPLSNWERWASLLGRLIILFSMVYVPLVYFTWTWRHYHVPKTASMQFLMMMLVACWGILVTRRRMVRSALATPVAFFFMIVMVTTLVAVNLAEAWETIIFLLACMVLLILVPKFLTRFKDFEILTYLLGIMCILVDIYGLALRFDWEMLFQLADPIIGIHPLPTTQPVSYMGNMNYTAEFLNMASPICFFMIIYYRRMAGPLIFYSIVTLLNAATMVYIDCNASYAGFLVAVPIATIIFIYFKALPWSRQIGLFRQPRKELERRFRQLIVLMVFGLSLVMVLIAMVPNPMRTKMASMASWMDVNGDLIPDGVAPIVFRLQCMDAASRNIMDSPIWGIGAGNFKVEHPLYESQLERKVLGEETLARKVHNDHLYHAVEFGVFGLWGWYWIITATFFAILLSLRLLEYQNLAAREPSRQTAFYHGLIFPRYQREFYFYLQLGILTALIVALISCAFGHTFVISSSAIIYWLLSGVGVAVYQNLYLAEKGIHNHLCGVTSESLTSVQRKTRRLPGSVWGGLVFLLILPLGALNSYQLIGETWLRHGMLERDTGNFYGMFECFKKALKIYPYQMETFYILGRYYIDADVAVETGMAQDSQGQRITPTGLNIEDIRKYLEEGIIILQADIFMNPNYKWAHNNLGVLYDRLEEYLEKEYDQKLAAYEDKLKQQPGEQKDLSLPESHELRDLQEQIVAVMEASRLTYNRVLSIDKEQIYAHYNLGLGAIKQKQWPQAIDSLNEALITDPSRYDIYRYLANCYMNNQNYFRAMRAAEKYLEKVILNAIRQSIRSQSDLVRYQPVIQSLSEGNYSDAIRNARQSMQWYDKDVYELFIGLASELSEKTEFSELALKALEFAELMNASPDPQTYLWHAKIYERLGNVASAADKLQEYLRLKPDDDEIRYALMMFYLEMDDVGKAAKLMEALIKSQPDNWRYLLTFARLKANQKDPWQEIFPYVERAIQIGGDEARKTVVENQPGNFILPFVYQDPNLQELLGASFVPAVTTQSATP